MATEFLNCTFSEFCRTVGVQLTTAQEIITSIAFDGANPRLKEHKDPKLCEVRKCFGELPDGPVDPDVRSIVVGVCGARGGKTYVFIALRLLHLAMSLDLSALAPGEMASAPIVAPDMRLARQALRYVKGIVESKLQSYLEEDNADQVVLNVRGRKVAIEALPATAGGRAVRGRSLVGAGLDEAAFFRDSDSVVNDEEIFKAVAPRIVPGGQVLVMSTPWSEAGLLYTMFEENWGRPTTALAIHAPTTLLRPDKRTAGMVARERKRDPENARREFDAVFMNTSGAQFFDTRTVDAAFDRYVKERPREGYKILATTVGADLGFTADHSAFAAVGRTGEGSEERYRLQDTETLRPAKGAPLKPSEVMTSLVGFAKKNYCETVWGDIHYQELVRETVSNAGLSFAEAPAGNEGKIEQYSKVRAMFAEGLPSLMEVDGLRDQLLGVTKKPLPGGGMTIQQKRSKTGGHSDLASALVLALWAAQHAGCGRILPGEAPGWREELDEDEVGVLGVNGSAFEL